MKRLVFGFGFLLAGVLASGCSDDSTSGYKSEDLTVETALSVGAAAPGQPVTASCTVTHFKDGVVDVGTVVSVSPAVGVRVEGHTLYGEAMGIYHVACALAKDPTKADTTPETLVISPGGAVSVDTAVAPSPVAAGAPAVVTCVARNPAGEVVTAETAVELSPTVGVTIEGHSVSSTLVGEYDVTCKLAANDAVRDATPAALLVVPAAPAKVTASIDGDTFPAGSLVDVSCLVEDAYGNAIEDAETTVEVAPEGGVNVTGHQLGLADAGTYEVFCRIVDNKDAESVPASLTVEPGQPGGIELFVEPDQGAYAPGDVVALSWVVTDYFGNAIEDAPVVFTPPASGVSDKGGYTFALDEEGAHTFIVAMSAPNSAISDSATLFVDATGPMIVITWPPRGATFDGDGNIQVQGYVTDAVSGIKSLELNNVKVTPDAEGNFTFNIGSAHGMNVVSAQAVDNAGNVGRAMATWYYSTAWTDFEGSTPQSVAVGDALKVYIGQEVLDDGVHDWGHIDDMATLLEILLANVDLAAIAGETLPAQVIPNVVFQQFDVLGQIITIQGDVIITPTISDFSLSDTPYISLSAIQDGIVAVGEFPPSPGMGGFEMQLDLAVELALTASTQLDLGICVLSVAAGVTPGFVTETFASMDYFGFSTAFLISKESGQPLIVNATDFELEVDGLEILPFQNTNLNLGKVQFGPVSCGPIPIPGDFSFNLPTVSLDFVVGPIGELVGGLIGPLTEFILDFAQPLIEPLLTTVASDVIKGVLESLEIEQAIDLPSLLGGDPKALTLLAKLDSVKFTAAGGDVGLAGAGWAEDYQEPEPLGAIRRDQCLGLESGSFAFDGAHPLGIGIHMDFLNELLFAAWRSGYLNIAASGEDLASLSPKIADYGVKSLSLVPLLPPLLTDCNGKGLLRLQLGDALVGVDVDFAGLAIQAEIYASLEIDAAIEAAGNELSVHVNGITQFALDTETVNDYWEGQEALLEDTIKGILLPQIEGLLDDAIGSFPIPELDLGGLVPGVPAGTVLQIGDTITEKKKGYISIQGDLL